MKTRVLIADDHPIFRQGLVKVIQDAGEFDVVAEAEDGHAALDAIARHRPALAVVDIGMPNMDGLELIRAASARSVKTLFVVLTMYNDEEYLREALGLGVRGYLLKESASVELLQCLRAVVGGKHYVSPSFTEYLLSGPDASGDGPVAGLRTLSPTERRILRLLSANRTSKEIAEELHISFRTVNNHRAHICEKLGLEGHNRLLQFALEHKSLL